MCVCSLGGVNISVAPQSFDVPVLAASLCLLRDGDDNISCRWLVEAAKLCMRVWDSLECHLNVYLSYKSGVLPKTSDFSLQACEY